MMVNKENKQILAVAGKIDEHLSSLVENIDILSSVTPLNYAEERQRFFDNRFSVEPSFTYKEQTFDVHQAKRDLYSLPIEKIDNEKLRLLYAEVIQSYADKLDQLSSIGGADFLYNSLRYYGEPSSKDVRNAHFLLHLPIEEDTSLHHDCNEIAAFMQQFCTEHGYVGEIEISTSMIANALVSGSKVKINAAASISTQEMHALAHHELGVHLLTTINARMQPLKLLSLGCPVNTTTQEGLAILCEFLSGHFSLKRLRTLALRVAAVESMITDRDFRRTFLLLKEQYKTDDMTAFTITSRVYRGGGYTKDYLYLSGFREILNAYDQLGDEFNLLLAGKTEIRYFSTIKALVEEGILLPPKLISPAIAKPALTDPIYKFVANALK
ncbi:flavohemoglobin expression-modulating QEGLA motif protein [Vibrio sp. S9_S30]|uniref:flavohemoglobin expression-modulating QEGLA motif protein n=1 Tax=Vibrio sp. S9_S30 TaxID=2720226 RepID=UPI0016809B04|nr:flavohemoglobin expression-modulating QEGLA motif protein [Vibrio sp. S9_S30]MBD1556901.1 flavohemoglobin expression-modulating QEGLA motif protein [Vibrio sp. S9_S30]